MKKKMKRSVVTVRWDSKRGPPGPAWRVRGPGDFDLPSYYLLKRAAVDYGRTIAKSNQPSQLVVYKKNGRIQTEYTYGGDPRRFKG